MCLLEQQIMYYEKLKPYTTGGRMLMLGNQYNHTKKNPNELFGTTEYKTLDPDEGDYLNDVQSDLSFMNQQWDSVFNLGTLEHVWDIHTAYSNAAKLVKVGGYFIGHAPVENYPNHGVHITHKDAIKTFFSINGFQHVMEFSYVVPGLDGGRILWHIEQKIEHVTEFKRPQQIWVKGKPSHFE